MKNFDNGLAGVNDIGVSKNIDTAKLVRGLKAQGLSYQQISEKLKISKQLAHYYGRPRPAEHICPACCRPLKKDQQNVKE